MKLDARKLHAATLTPPPSKSDAHRAVTLAWMLGLPEPELSSWPTDVRRLGDGLHKLGTGETIDCGDGAAPFRILVALAAGHRGTSVLTGSPRLLERPHEPLLRALGLTGLRIEGRDLPDTLRVDCTLSSQYASGLVLAGCATKKRFTLHLEGTVASRGYLDMTIRWARAAGFAIDETERTVRITGHERVTQLPPVPPDWSSLGYLLVMAKATGSSVAVENAGEHPDRAIVQYLDARAIDADVAACPDLAPTLAAMILGGDGAGTLRNTGVLRHKESDRLAAIMDLAQAVGARAVLDGDTLALTPSARPAAFTFDCRRDHRLTMSAVTLACLLRCRAELFNEDGVDKSFPGFWEQTARLGVRTS